MCKIKVEKSKSYLVTDKNQRYYLTGFFSSEGKVLLTENKTVLFLDDRYYFAAVNALKNQNVTIKRLSDFDLLSFESLGIDFEKTTVKDYLLLKERAKDIFDISKELKTARSVKNEGEIAKISSACKIIETAFFNAIKHLKIGVTEKYISDILLKEIKAQGGDGFSFEPIIAFGKNSCVPHHSTGDTVLGSDVPVLMDIGAVKDGYCSDMTRTLFFGNPTEDFLKAYDAVKLAGETAEKKITDGTPCSVADGFSRDVLRSYGMDKYFTHSLGHGIGLDVHEAPTLRKSSEEVLRDNMVFSIEPGVYFDGEFGIRIEDTVVLQNGKVKRLFNDDKKLIII